MATESVGVCILCNEEILTVRNRMVFEREKTSTNKWIHFIRHDDAKLLSGMKCVCPNCALAVSDELGKPKRKG